MPIGSGSMSNEARELMIPIICSFEAGEKVTGLQLSPPPSVDWELVGANYEVIKALGATAAGTIDVKTSGGAALAITQISIAGAAALGVRGAAVLSAVKANLRAGAGQVNSRHEITTAKGATAAGKVLLTLFYRRVRPNLPATVNLAGPA